MARSPNRTLSDLTRSTGKLAAEGARRGGQRSRLISPDYRSPSIASSRPKSASGVSFHFGHRYVSKGSRGYGRGKDNLSRPKPGTGSSSVNPRPTPAILHQRYIERDEAIALRDDGSPVSFGTLGDTPGDRRSFWRKLEDAETAVGRVQNRIIAELPKEVDLAGREEIAREFCSVFESKGLPFWCVLHAPNSKNHRDNHHLHIVYSERPALRLEDGRWDFEIVEERRYTNGSKRPVRPYRQPKDRSARGRDWIVELRHRFAAANNAVLESYGSPKRLDPRPYSESGVPKEPGIHLGPKAHALEKAGLDTRPGRRNAETEIRFRRIGWDSDLLADMHRMEGTALEFDSWLRADLSQPLRRTAERARVDSVRHRELTLERLRLKRQEELHRLAVEAASRRAGLRKDHLRKSALSLLRSSVTRRAGSGSHVTRKILQHEADLVEAALANVEGFVSRCREVIVDIRNEQAGLLREQRQLAHRIAEARSRLRASPYDPRPVDGDIAAVFHAFSVLKTEIAPEAPGLERAAPGAREERGPLTANRGPLADVVVGIAQDLASTTSPPFRSSASVRSRIPASDIDELENLPSDLPSDLFSGLSSGLSSDLPVGPAAAPADGAPADGATADGATADEPDPIAPFRFNQAPTAGSLRRSLDRLTALTDAELAERQSSTAQALASSVDIIDRETLRRGLILLQSARSSASRTLRNEKDRYI